MVDRLSVCNIQIFSCVQSVLLLMVGVMWCNHSSFASFAASGLPHSFILMHQNRYQQCIGAFILQAASESAKVGHFDWDVFSWPVVQQFWFVIDYQLNQLIISLNLLCVFSERVDVKDGGCCDCTAEAGLSAAARQQLLTVAGVLTDLTRRTLEAIWNESLSMCPQVF